MLADRLFEHASMWGREIRAWMAQPSQQALDRAFAQPVELLIERDHGSVVAYHPIACEIGHSILRQGGNAFDAFVASAAAENVLAEGASSLAGALVVLLYRADGRSVHYLDADFNTPLNPDAVWSPEHAAAGRAVLVPGMPAGLAGLASAHAKLSLPDLLEPAIGLAENGFVVGRLMAHSIADRAKILSRTPHGRSTYLPRSGEPLKQGDTLRLPKVADFLRGLARQGPGYVYGGEFGQRFLEVVRNEGGALSSADLAAYRIHWCQTLARGLSRTLHPRGLGPELWRPVDPTGAEELGADPTRG